MKIPFLALFFAIFSTLLTQTTHAKIDQKRNFALHWDTLQSLQEFIPQSIFDLQNRYFSQDEMVKMSTDIIVEGCLLGHATYIKVKKILSRGERFQNFNQGNIISEGPVFLYDPYLKIDLLSSENASDPGIITLTSPYLNKKRVLFFPPGERADSTYNDILALQTDCLTSVTAQTPVPHDSISHLEIPQSHKEGTYPVRENTLENPQYATLIDSAESFKLRFHLIKNAKERIFVQSLNFHGDESAVALAEALIEARRKKGLRIDVPTDALSNIVNVMEGFKAWKNYPRVLNNMLAAGINVYGHDCSSIKFSLRQLKRSITDKKPLTYLRRPHEKYVIVDDQVIVGGTNTTNSYFGVNPDGKHNWYDHDVYVQGKELAKDFWNTAEDTIQFFEENFPMKNEKCMNPYTPGTQDFEDYYQAHAVDYILDFKEDHQYAQERVDEFVAEGRDHYPVDHSKRVLTKAQILHSRPRLNETHIQDSLVQLIDESKKEVVLMNAYFIPPEEIKEALFRAIDRGVKVVIVTNSKETNDLDFVAGIGSYYAKDFLDRGNYDLRKIEFHLWNGKRSQEPGSKQYHGLLHSKLFVFDRKIAFVSSYNLDYSSVTNNSELGLVFESTELAEDIRQTIIKDSVPFTRPYTYAQALYDRKARKLRRLWKNPHLAILKKLEKRL